jgi:hypothetical protein
MLMMKWLSLLEMLLVLTAQTAQAQRVNLEVEGGRVTLDAENVAVRVILDEWSTGSS